MLVYEKNAMSQEIELLVGKYGTERSALTADSSGYPKEI